jgi:hypothetical protein
VPSNGVYVLVCINMEFPSNRVLFFNIFTIYFYKIQVSPFWNCCNLKDGLTAGAPVEVTAEISSVRLKTEINTISKT